eukprot:snap_masked-scaffold_54-processed-gene-1.65-mRNA-1 protein AED:1.00 eAED:1.00 QI:0/-1/0/0/-1/1/1/0/297
MSISPPNSAPTNTQSASNKYLYAGIASASALSLGLIIYSLTRRPKSTKQKALTSANQQNLETVEILPIETLVKIFGEITLQMQSLILKLAQEEQQILQRGNLNLTNQQLQDFLLNRFQDAVTLIEEKVYKSHDTFEQQVKVSCEKHEDDPKLKSSIEQLKSVYGAVMNAGKPQEAENVSLPDFLTRDKTLEILVATMAILRSEAASVSKALERQGFSREKDAAKFQAEFQGRYGKAVEKKRDALYEKEKIESDMIMQAAVRKYQFDAVFQEQLKKESFAHNEKMVAMGFQVPNMPTQ